MRHSSRSLGYRQANLGDRFAGAGDSGPLVGWSERATFRSGRPIGAVTVTIRELGVEEKLKSPRIRQVDLSWKAMAKSTAAWMNSVSLTALLTAE